MPPQALTGWAARADPAPASAATESAAVDPVEMNWRRLWNGLFDIGWSPFGVAERLLCSPSVGAWRSLVAHLHGVQGVGGSNPLAPTNSEDSCSPESCLEHEKFEISNTDHADAFWLTAAWRF